VTPPQKWEAAMHTRKAHQRNYCFCERQEKAMSQEKAQWQFHGQSVRILYLCTNNSARSQMAEALTRHLSKEQVVVYSAGSRPAKDIQPEATRAISQLGADMSQYVPKSVEKFNGKTFDRVVILCDKEHESCPTFVGSSKVILWDTPDPVKVEGTEADRSRAFQHLAMELNTRIRLLLTLLEREKRPVSKV
jgi:arsenate reductase